MFTATTSSPALLAANVTLAIALTFCPKSRLGQNPEKVPKMSIASKLLPALALAIALSPVAAQARRTPQPGPAQYYLAPLHHQDALKSSYVDKVMVGSATIDRPSPYYSNASTGT
jgi:hypothetical protein